MARLEQQDVKAMEEELIKAGLYAVREAKRRAPVDTGRLRASITLADSTGLIERPGTEASSNDAVTAPTELGVRIGTNVEYADYIEYGTENRAAQPFLRPAWDAAKQRFNIRTD